ncbi:Polyisoprenoid-binding protein YceI [Mariniphaga anaerophila]|uniref:Polyisoprenoid-binding protein YceI n=2 Tax=Mariniphaga anaerophila TaxID=1484053 RepID=A0A1M5CI81_9BACT|nr:Polyisoprenoid-binding protein YceI [Mariniphaga anaerophila]
MLLNHVWAVLFNILQQNNGIMETQEKTKWVLDPAHSEILFKVKHLMITNVKGEFRTFSAEAFADGTDFSSADVNVTIDALSVFTNNDDRDAHLRSADFFDVENNKTITFKSLALNRVDDGEFELTGLLTIRGIAKKVTLDVEFGGINKDPWGNKKAGFSLEGKISRKDWNLNWNAALEAGGVLVGDEVKISAEVQFTQQA